MDAEYVYCPGCNHRIRLTHTAEHRDGHANLPDGAQLVCLDFGEGCSEGRCPVTGTPGVVMGVRLARSGLGDERFETVTATCDACGQVADHKVVDETYAVCPLCESTNRWVSLTLDGDAVSFTVG